MRQEIDTASREQRSLLARIFISPSEPRLRAGWRLASQGFLHLTLLLIVGGGLLLILWLMRGGFADPLGPEGVIVSQMANLVAATTSVFICRRFLDRRSFVSLGLGLNRNSYIHIAIGTAIALVMMALIFVCELALGWLEVTGFAWQTQGLLLTMGGVLTFLTLCILVGWNEELVSRGYQLQTISAGMTLTWGWMLSSAIFGLLHATNPHANLMSTSGIVLAGLFLGYAYMRTGQLWLSIGLHIGWNFFEGVVFGFPVSGIPFFAIPKISVSGPVAWTGGDFGPEAGLIVVPALIVGFVLVHLVRGKSMLGVA